MSQLPPKSWWWYLNDWSSFNSDIQSHDIHHCKFWKQTAWDRSPALPLPVQRQAGGPTSRELRLLVRKMGVILALTPRVVMKTQWSHIRDSHPSPPGMSSTPNKRNHCGYCSERVWLHAGSSKGGFAGLCLFLLPLLLLFCDLIQYKLILLNIWRSEIENQGFSRVVFLLEVSLGSLASGSSWPVPRLWSLSPIIPTPAFNLLASLFWGPLWLHWVHPDNPG